MILSDWLVVVLASKLNCGKTTEKSNFLKCSQIFTNLKTFLFMFSVSTKKTVAKIQESTLFSFYFPFHQKTCCGFTQRNIFDSAERFFFCQSSENNEYEISYVFLFHFCQEGCHNVHQKKETSTTRRAKTQRLVKTLLRLIPWITRGF